MIITNKNERLQDEYNELQKNDDEDMEFGDGGDD